MGAFRNTDVPKYALTNKRLIPWLKRNVRPKSWIIELTGGEPALYRELPELIDFLNESGYRGLIKTNGTLSIEASDNFRRIAAFHNLNSPPKYFDEILIVDKLQREEKEAYCRAQGWPYHVIGYNKETFDNAGHGFRKCAFMDPHGHPTPCPSAPVLWSEWPDKHALEYTGLKAGLACPNCKAAVDAWRFLPESWKI